MERLTSDPDNRLLDLAKTSPHILCPERFALHIGTHIVSKYTHINRAFVTIEKLRWSRIALSANGDIHPHSFVRDGDDKQTVEVEVRVLILHHCAVLEWWSDDCEVERFLAISSAELRQPPWSCPCF